MLPTLDARLAAAAELVRPGEPVADIGCDHGKLTAVLAASGKYPKVIGADLRPGPLAKAEQTLEHAGCKDRAELRLGDGLSVLTENEVGSIVLAGVSAQTTWEILEKAPWVFTVGGPRIIMIPATRHDALRRWLWEHGFSFAADRPVQAAGRWYAVMAAEYTGEKKTPAFTECLFGRTAEWPEGAGYAAWQKAKLPRFRLGVPDGTELAEEMDIAGNLAVCYGIGCYVAGLMNVDLDMFPALHGRGCAVATGFKRCRPEQLVITYQGDGDCASIGLGDTLQAAARGENITTIMVNNQNYGCTGGQLAPTTPLGMVTNTSPYGRSVEAQGYPIHMAELVAQMDGCRFAARGALTTPAQIRKSKEYLRRAITLQQQGQGYTFVELLSACPSTYKVPFDQVREFQEKNVFPIFDQGVFKDE